MDYIYVRPISCHMNIPFCAY